MLARALRLAALSSLLTPCASALAHGLPPTAYAVVTSDGEGAQVVRLSTGLALRRGRERFQFVCPAAWGDESAAPLAALDDGTVVVGAVNGLMLMAPDGALRAHPDPEAAGISTELLRTEHGVFSLRVTQDSSQVLAIDAQSARVLWQDARSWYSIGAHDDVLVLLRASNAEIEQLTLAASDGKERERQLATLGAPVDYVFTRATRGGSYVLTLTQNAPVLGSLSANAFSKIAQGASTIAGPLRVGDETLLAVDGQLSRLQNGEVMALAESAYLLCLEESEGVPYACTPDGIKRVRGEALGEPLFELSWLLPPDLSQLPAGKPRERCDYQWQDMRFDLLALGVPVRGDEPDAGAAVDAAAEAEREQDAALRGDAPAQAEDAGRGGTRTGDCSVHTFGGDGGLGKGLVLLLVLESRRRRLRRA